MRRKFTHVRLSISDKGIDFIARTEGFSSKEYIDTAGYPTIGYGHKLLPGESYPNNISREDALRLLRGDIRMAEQTVRSNVRVNLTQYQLDALVSFIFNVGVAAFKGSTFLRLLNDCDYNGAAGQFQRWNKITVNGVLKPDKGLTRRRIAECNLFLHNKYE